MQIGGSDVIIKTKVNSTVMPTVVKTIIQYWPKATFENAISGDKFDKYGKIPFKQLDELFIHRDAEIEIACDSGEWPPNTMIYVIARDNDFTIIVDDPEDAEMKKIIDAIKLAIKNDQLKVI